MKVQTVNLSWSADTQKIIKSINLEANSGETVGIVGPNGSGKSSILRLIYRYYSPNSGAVLLNGDDISFLNSKDLAKAMSVVAQERDIAFDFTVNEVVMMGRNPYKGIFDRDTNEDRAIVQKSLKRVGMYKFAEREFYTLSGGEKQRVLIALALAKQSRMLILDEPTSHLDIRYQLEIMEIVRSLPITTLIAMHDLNHAATYCDRIYLLKKGRIIAEGLPREVITPEMIKSVYGVNINVVDDSLTGRMNVILLGKNRKK